MAKTKTKKTARAKPEVPVLVQLLRARMGKRSISGLARESGVAYSRVYHLLKDDDGHRAIANLEAVLRAVCPTLLREVTDPKGWPWL